MEREERGIQKPLLAAAELEAATGLTSSQVYRWTAEGVFPAHLVLRTGRRVYYRAALIDWLAGRDGTVLQPLARAQHSAHAASKEVGANEAHSDSVGR